MEKQINEYIYECVYKLGESPYADAQTLRQRCYILMKVLMLPDFEGDTKVRDILYKLVLKLMSTPYSVAISDIEANLRLMCELKKNYIFDE